MLISVLVLSLVFNLCDAAPRRVGFPLNRFPGAHKLQIKKRGSVDSSACLDAHNTKRALHSASPLTWDDELARKAQRWANHLASIGSLKHDPNAKAGENLYFSYSSVPQETSCQDAVNAWYAEIKDYDFNNPHFSHKTGHFTQVVWQATTKLGVAKATTVRGRGYVTYIVARYAPPGNYLGQFAENVSKN